MSHDITFTPVSTHGSQVGMKKDLKFIPGLPEGLSSAGFYLRKNLRFTPSAEGMLKRGNVGEYTLDWWTDTAIFRHDALMVSTAYGLEKSNFREFYNIPRKDFLFIADSGGYQIFTQQIQIEPVDILRWIESNADIGLTLDSPPLKTGEQILNFEETPRASEQDFKLSIEKSRRNYEIMHRNRQSDKLKLLKVIHGWSIKELNQFYDAVKDLQFDGHAFGANPNDIRTVALILGFAQTIEKERIHMFLMTGRYTAPVVIYGKRFFNHLTFDSSTFSSTGARYRKYFYPGIVGQGISFGDSYTSTLKELPCTCPVCQLTTVETLNQEGSLPGGLIALHNLYQCLEYFHTLEKLADSTDDYIAYLKLQNSPPEVIRMIEYLRCIEEEDFDSANKKFNMSDVGKKSVEEYFAT